MVARVLAEQFAGAEAGVEPETLLWDDLGADSLDIIEIVLALQEASGCEISTEEENRLVGLGKAVRVQDLTDLVQRVAPDHG